jgi:hypothetical protein
MAERHIEERFHDPMNILIVFLLGLAAVLFVIGSMNSFDLDSAYRVVFIVGVFTVYAIVSIFFLKSKKIKTPIEINPEIIERQVERFIDRPIEKIIYKDRPVEKIVERKVVEPVIVQRKEKARTKFVGSNYNHKYHLRSCRFSGAIKPKYLVEEHDKKYFEIRSYEPCKVCKPDEE